MQTFYGVNWEIVDKAKKTVQQEREKLCFRARDGKLEYACYCAVKCLFPLLGELRPGERVIIQARVVPSTRAHSDFLDVLAVSRIIGAPATVPDGDPLAQLRDLEI